MSRKFNFMNPALVAVCWLIANVNFLKHSVLSVLVLTAHTVAGSETSCGAAAASMGTSQSHLIFLALQELFERKKLKIKRSIMSQAEDPGAVPRKLQT